MNENLRLLFQQEILKNVKEGITPSQINKNLENERRQMKKNLKKDIRSKHLGIIHYSFTLKIKLRIWVSNYSVFNYDIVENQKNRESLQERCLSKQQINDNVANNRVNEQVTNVINEVGHVNENQQEHEIEKRDNNQERHLIKHLMKEGPLIYILLYYLFK